MKKENTSIRLKKIMSERGLRQIDILELCKPYCKKYDIKLGRNDLSQYVTGKVEPGQKKLTLLGMALNVNEVWLMGYDVPMERNTYEDQRIMIFDAELDEALNILVSEGYSWNYTQSPDYDIVIKNKSGKIIECIPDNELVHRYESVKNTGTVTAELLISTAFTLYPEEKDHISKYRDLDQHGKKMVDFTLNEEWERSIAEQKAKEKIVPIGVREDTNYVNAAHADDYMSAPDELKRLEENIMDDENF